MRHETYAVVLLLGCGVSLVWSKTAIINITIDITKGNDTSNCGNNSIPCQSLNYAIPRLPIANNCNHSHIALHIRNGNYSYSLNGSDSKYQFRSCDQVNITGEGDSHVIVTCAPGAGFVFFNTNVIMSNVQFKQCGAIQNSTSTASSSATETLPAITALYFAFCKQVHLSNVYVTRSNASAVVMYNTRNLLVEDSHFLNNSVDPEALSNAAFYVEFCYCDPGVTHDNCTPHDNTGGTYRFYSSYFIGNNVLKVNNYNRTFYIPYKNDYFSFGRGGGLSIVFKGDAQSNSVNVEGCTFTYNAALWGGGVFVEFEDDSKNNIVNFTNTSFGFNHAGHSPNNGTGGGGARVGFLHFNDSSAGFYNNTVMFDHSNFSRNSANHGGGFSLMATPELHVKTSTNMLILTNCEFLANDASLGAAIDLSTWHSIKKGLPAMVEIKDSNFTKNGLNCTAGAVYADSVPANFCGNILFKNNRGSALSIFGTAVNFTENCQAQFVNNQGWSGGAIALLGNAYMGINPGVNFTFHNNSAYVEGGAIYALLTSQHDIFLSSRNCFLQYSNKSIHPNEWNATFTFINNSAPMGNSIYTTSLLPCVWNASYGTTNNSTREVFNWTNVFSYTPDDQLQISSGIASLSLNTEVNMNIVPGNVTALPIYPLDDRHQGTQGSVWLYTISGEKEVSVYPSLTADYKVTLYGHPGNTSQIMMVTRSARNVSLTLNITLEQCPPGYKWNDTTKVCECRYEDWQGILYCDDVSFTSYLARGYWAGYILSNNSMANKRAFKLVTVKCPSQFCTNFDTPFRRQLTSQANDTALDHLICSPQKRTGKLCGNCTKDHGVAINVNAFQFNCTHCSDTKYSWLVYVLSEFLPLNIFFIIILFFDINIHSGVTSSIILYFQVFDALRIVSDDELPPPPDSSKLIKAIQFLYNIWNLQFFGSLLPPYCLAKDLNAMDVLSINYASGLYPFVLLFIVYLLNKLSFPCWSQSERFQQVRQCFRRFWYRLKWRVAVKKSILSGLATVWTLAFTKLALISFLILSRTSLNSHTHVATYQGTLPFLKNKHLQYAIPAFIISILFVYIPATGLLCYPLVPQLIGKLKRWIPLDNYVFYYKISSCLERPFIKLKPIIDCFQGSYKPHFEFFAGLLFWYRLIIFTVFAYSVQRDTYFWNIVVSVVFLVIIGVVQPFKKSLNNTVMSLSVVNIIMISMMNIYLLDHYHELKLKSDYKIQWWQLRLVVLPLIFITFYVIWKAMKKIQAWRKGLPPKGLYVNYSNSHDNTPRTDPLLSFPAQVWDGSENVHNSDDNNDDNDEDDYNYRESSNRRNMNNVAQHDDHSTQHSSSRRESSRRSQSDLDRRRCQTFSETPSSDYVLYINNGSDK